MMRTRPIYFTMLAIWASACKPSEWPEPPAVSPTRYQSEYDAWRSERHSAIARAVQIVGLWPLLEGDSPFGGDPTLQIALRGPGIPAHVGTFRRTGESVTVLPPSEGRLQLEDGRVVTAPMLLQSVMAERPTILKVGSLRLQLEEVEEVKQATDQRRWISAWDEHHPAVESLPPVEAYPPDQRWRVAAKFEALRTPRPIRVPDVRGGTIDLVASGQLVFRLNGQDHRLTAIDLPGAREFLVMFKDSTNRTTTYGGYRMLFPQVPTVGEWTVLDFNQAANPPCAYSNFTTCPLPPKENRLEVAVEAGEKRYPHAVGYAAP